MLGWAGMVLILKSWILFAPVEDLRLAAHSDDHNSDGGGAPACFEGNTAIYSQTIAANPWLEHRFCRTGRDRWNGQAAQVTGKGGDEKEGVAIQHADSPHTSRACPPILLVSAE